MLRSRGDPPSAPGERASLGGSPASAARASAAPRRRRSRSCPSMCPICPSASSLATRSSGGCTPPSASPSRRRRPRRCRARRRRGEGGKGRAQGGAAFGDLAAQSGRATVIGMGGSGKTMPRRRSRATSPCAAPSTRFCGRRSGRRPTWRRCRKPVQAAHRRDAAGGRLARGGARRALQSVARDQGAPAARRRGTRRREAMAFLDLGPASRSRCIVTTRIRGRFKGAELDLASLAEEGCTCCSPPPPSTRRTSPRRRRRRRSRSCECAAHCRSRSRSPPR